MTAEPPKLKLKLPAYSKKWKVEIGKKKQLEGTGHRALQIRKGEIAILGDRA